MEEYKYAVVSGGLYLNDTDASSIKALAYGVTYHHSTGYDESYGTMQYYSSITNIGYNTTSYSDYNTTISIFKEYLDNSDLAIRYQTSITFTSASNINLKTKSVTAGGYYNESTVTTALSNVNSLTANYTMDFYYPGNVNKYKLYYTNSSSHYIKTGGLVNVTSRTYLFAKITSCSIETFNGNVLRTRLLDALYE